MAPWSWTSQPQELSEIDVCVCFVVVVCLFKSRGLWYFISPDCLALDMSGPPRAFYLRDWNLLWCFSWPSHHCDFPITFAWHRVHRAWCDVIGRTAHKILGESPVWALETRTYLVQAHSSFHPFPLSFVCLLDETAAYVTAMTSYSCMIYF